jgi:hypothetical protein
MDGVDDETGEPIVEQVLEYHGKLTGDVVGEIAYNYGKTYNNAFIVVEDIGGYGSATLLTLMNLKYDNLYYDDPSLKKFTSINDATPMTVTKDGRLPGFHSNSVRWAMLSALADRLRTNSFKLRSVRSCNELLTWLIMPNGRIDHKEGAHDDTLTCLAMGLFVMEHSINRQMKQRDKDVAMLKSMISVNSRIEYNLGDSRNFDRINAANPNAVKKFPTAVITGNKTQEHNSTYNANMWLFK